MVGPGPSLLNALRAGEVRGSKVAVSLETCSVPTVSRSEALNVVVGRVKSKPKPRSYKNSAV
jgi:hypothetical protein